MNLLLLLPEDWREEGVAEIGGRRYLHAEEVLKLSQRSGECRAGVLNGPVGRAVIESVDPVNQRMRLRFLPEREPPPPLPLILAAALPRPLTLRKVVHAAVSMGVKELWFFQSWKVEKSYWSSPMATEENLREQMLLALEQAVDTKLPELHFQKHFRTFVEEDLPRIGAGGRLLAAHPDPAALPCPRGLSGKTTLVVGPEGGFTPREVEQLTTAGSEIVGLGPRILRTEVAVTTLIARLFDGAQ